MAERQAGDGYYPQEVYYAPGWQAPVQPPRDRRRRRVLPAVLAGVVVGGLLVGAVLGVRFWLGTRALGEVTGPVTATARQVQPGHCVQDLPSDGPVTRVTVVPCGEPHAAEVVGAHVLEAQDWPGQQQVDREAAAACEMDTAQEAAGFRAVVWTPGQAAWGQGDRTALCLAWYEGGGVRGSWTDDGEVTTP